MRPEPRAGAERIDAVLGGQHEHHEDQPRTEQRRAGRDRKLLFRFDLSARLDRVVIRHARK